MKDNGGAASDYQLTLRRLETNCSIITSLQNLAHPKGNTPILNAIRGLALSMKHDIEDCLKDIQKFDTALGQSRKEGYLRGTIPKVKWAQYIGHRTHKLCQATDRDLSSLTTLIGMHLR